MEPSCRRIGRIGAALIAASLLLTACASDSTPSTTSATSAPSGDTAGTGDTTDTAGPGDDADPGDGDPGDGGIGTGGVTDWPIAAPSEVGLDTEVLDEMATEAEAAESACLLIARDGRIAAETYWGDEPDGEPQEVFSVTKSFASIVVGIAADDGSLDLDDSASEQITEWADTPAAEVTIADLLANDSGREWSPAIDYAEMVGADDHTGFAIDLGQPDPPGTVWAYNNSAIQTLDRVVARATDEPFDEFGTRRLLEPLGMDDSSFTVDGAGNTLTFMGLQSTCRDLARFGVLLLADGRWNGEQIVSTDYVDAATNPSQDLTSAYGRLFWLNRRGPVASALEAMTLEDSAAAPDAQLVPDRPERLYWALGLGGQVIQMDPVTNTVVVRLGPPALSDPTGAEGGGYGPAATARVLDAVDDASGEDG